MCITCHIYRLIVVYLASFHVAINISCEQSFQARGGKASMVLTPMQKFV